MEQAGTKADAPYLAALCILIFACEPIEDFCGKPQKSSIRETFKYSVHRAFLWIALIFCENIFSR